jgi:hypothetical protein
MASLGSIELLKAIFYVLIGWLFFETKRDDVKIQKTTMIRLCALFIVLCSVSLSAVASVATSPIGECLVMSAVVDAAHRAEGKVVSTVEPKAECVGSFRTDVAEVSASNLYRLFIASFSENSPTSNVPGTGYLLAYVDADDGMCSSVVINVNCR